MKNAVIDNEKNQTPAMKTGCKKGWLASNGGFRGGGGIETQVNSTLSCISKCGNIAKGLQESNPARPFNKRKMK